MIRTSITMTQSPMLVLLPILMLCTSPRIFAPYLLNEQRYHYFDLTNKSLIKTETTKILKEEGVGSPNTTAGTDAHVSDN